MYQNLACLGTMTLPKNMTSPRDDQYCPKGDRLDGRGHLRRDRHGQFYAAPAQSEIEAFNDVISGRIVMC